MRYAFGVEVAVGVPINSQGRFGIKLSAALSCFSFRSDIFGSAENLDLSQRKSPVFSRKFNPQEPRWNDVWVWRNDCRHHAGHD